MTRKISNVVMPSVNWTVPNAELVVELEKSLQRIQEIVRGQEG